MTDQPTEPDFDGHAVPTPADGAPDPGDEARYVEARRLAKVMRAVVERMVATRAPAEGLAEAADRLGELVAWLDGYPQGSLYEGFAEAANAGTPRAFFDNSPMMGLANPLAPPIHLEVVGDEIQGRVRFGSAYEGAPGCVHGGFVAAAFDDVLGLTQTLSGNPGMTGTITVKYRSPTPIHTDLSFRGWIDRVEGRKIFCEGTLHAGDTLCAESDAVFISVGRDRFLELKDQRPGRMAQRDD